MRTGKTKINDKEYHLCLSPRVLMALEERGLSLETMFSDTSHQVTNIFTLLWLMIDAGHRWAVMNGEESTGTITLDEIIDSVDFDEYGRIVDDLAKVLTQERKIEATAPK